MAQIVVVDDCPDFRSALAGILRQEGHDVREQAGGSDLLASDTWRSASAILLDVRMPGMDGIEVAALLRRGGFTGRLVFVTGLPQSLLVPWVGRLGKCRVLSKPVGRAELRAGLSE
jgi:CheY-like chemotaxis protein